MVCLQKPEINSDHLSKIKLPWGLLKGYRSILYNSKVEYTLGTQSGFGIKRSQGPKLHSPFIKTHLLQVFHWFFSLKEHCAFL